LNHFTVPVAIEKHLPLPLVNGRWRRLAEPQPLVEGPA
jgi:hypothetical protein